MIVEKEMMNNARQDGQKWQDENHDQGNHPRIHWNAWLGFLLFFFFFSLTAFFCFDFLAESVVVVGNFYFGFVRSPRSTCSSSSSSRCKQQFDTKRRAWMSFGRFFFSALLDLNFFESQQKYSSGQREWCRTVRVGGCLQTVGWESCFRPSLKLPRSRAHDQTCCTLLVSAFGSAMAGKNGTLKNH